MQKMLRLLVAFPLCRLEAKNFLSQTKKNIDRNHDEAFDTNPIDTSYYDEGYRSTM
jgi:hypothetical protein